MSCGLRREEVLLRNERRPVFDHADSSPLPQFTLPALEVKRVVDDSESGERRLDVALPVGRDARESYPTVDRQSRKMCSADIGCSESCSSRLALADTPTVRASTAIATASAGREVRTTVETTSVTKVA